jgi:hypothetical protein
LYITKGLKEITLDKVYDNYSGVVTICTAFEIFYYCAKNLMSFADYCEDIKKQGYIII